MKYTCLVVDDHMLERDALVMHIGKIDQLEILAVCADGLEAAKVLATTPVDIVFSDIDMPDLSGFGLVKSMKPPVVIFISSHPEYAAESFNLDVVDFIVKPATLERVMRAANKAIEYINLKKTSTDNNSPLSNEIADDYFFIRESHDLIKIRFEEVTYIESMGDFSRIYTLEGKKHTTLVSLKNLEAQLPEQVFMRIHKQYIINYHHITAISTDDITLHHTYSVPFGNANRQTLMDKVVNKKIVTRFS
jgi:two-component system LytT family response regulator